MTVVKLLLKYILNYRGKRTDHARRLFFLLARRFTPAFMVETEAARYLVSTNDPVIGQDLFLQGTFDSDVMKRVFQILPELGFPALKDRLFVDVGANIGTNCITALIDSHCASALAIEPDPDTYRLLRHNLLENNLEEKARALNLSLSSAPGFVLLQRDPVTPGNNWVAVPSQQQDPATAIRVESITFDSLLTAGHFSLEELGLVWMDTQGHEGHILAGAQALRQTGLPVVIEYWPHGLRRADGLELLEHSVLQSYSHFIDLRKLPPDSTPEPTPIAEFPKLQQTYHGHTFTDVLLFRRQ